MQLLTFDPRNEREDQFVELGTGDDARTFRVVSEWSRKSCEWLLSFYEADGREIVVNARVSPGVPMIIDTNVLHPTNPKTSLVFITGPDPYDQADLGTRVKVFFAAYSELSDPPAGDGTVFTL